MTVDVMRRTLDNFLPFLVGLVVGVLTTYASISREITTLNVTVSQHSESIRELTIDEESSHDLLLQIATQLHLQVRP